MVFLAKKILVLALVVVALTACGAAATQSSGSSTAATGGSGAAAPATATGANPTLAPASSSPAATAVAAAPVSGMRVFQIVPEQSQAQYEVQEKFLSRSLPNKAVGTTKAISGTFQFSLAGKPAVGPVSINVDLRTLTSDESRRDQRIRSQWLQSNTYPTAQFVSTNAENLPDSYTEGQAATFKLNGNMTIHQVTKPVTFDVHAKLQGGTVTGTAATIIMMKDFGFDPPSVAGMLTVTDGVNITVNFTAKEAAAK